MEERIELIVGEEKKIGGLSLSVIVSLVAHAALLAFFILTYRPANKVKQDVPMARYVELMRQNPQQFTEAPGPAIDKAPMRAPLSDANRKASAPEPPTGDVPTTRPGDDSGLYTPPSAPAAPAARPRPSVPGLTPGASPPAQQAPSAQPDPLAYREPTQANAAAANGNIDWRSAIQEVGKVASLGGGDGIDLNQMRGGEKGFYEQGPLSFESQWYDWGEYAQSMVSRIRVNWYANMPQLIRTGMKGVVTIRFTIMKDGHIEKVEIVKGSGIPPYDFAAKKAIELSSPLNPLPKDFPMASERVTAMFYYNMEVPNR